MKIIVGLGNPGKKFERTRHNLGFLVIDNLVKKLQDKKKQSFALCEIFSGKIKDEKIIIAKPLTFMNLSGQATRFLANKFKISSGDIFVVHDDIDLPLAALRISQGRGPGGHKGIASIIEALGSKNFIRFRLGIHPLGQTFAGRHLEKKIATEKFVLKKFAKNEKEAVRLVLRKTSKAIITAIKKGLAAAMNEFN